ncbi:MAG TPA: sigma 54-interacting transcriptional regulator [Candidatus Avidesulfovibrio excrementigallinarum]|nr:sigma 54-interacting transcriptional regulator [Candidatus Avidesulfovibrio excrementigallinarum]
MPLARDSLFIKIKDQKKGPVMEIVGTSQAIQRLKDRIRKVARTDAAVLIQGESGTGKELVAMSIHEQSRRHCKEFVAINCGAIPESLMESLLFGYEGGAFSGARKDGQRGLLEKANGGTLFLDEAGEMPYSLQAKMLRTLQNFKIRRVGGSSVFQLDVRIIAASNKDLRKEVERGAFREDLFYRLDIIPLIVPPLRERREDIPLLVKHFLDLLGKNEDRQFRVTPALMQRFIEYDWPGNVRELKNFIEYGVCFCEGDVLTTELMGTRFAMGGVAVGTAPRPQPRSGAENAQLHALLDHFGHSVEGKRKAAAQLGISLATLYRRLRAEREC